MGALLTQRGGAANSREPAFLVGSSVGGKIRRMSFQDELRAEALRAKANHPGFDRAIDPIVEDFQARKVKGEFENWDWYMIAEEFHSAVGRKCAKRRLFKSSKRGRK